MAHCHKNYSFTQLPNYFIIPGMFKQLTRFFQKEKTSPIPAPVANGLMQVTADSSRCVQCGICGYNCPVGIPVREYARRGQNVTDSRCIACGVCVEKCPRGTLRWGPAILVRADNTIEINPDEI